MALPVTDQLITQMMKENVRTIPTTEMEGNVTRPLIISDLIKAQKDASNLQKDYSPQRAYETAVAARIESRSKLDTWQKPDIYQAFPEATSEHDIYVLRALRDTEDEQGKEIAANRMGYVPFDQCCQVDFIMILVLEHVFKEFLMIQKLLKMKVVILDTIKILFKKVELSKEV